MDNELKIYRVKRDTETNEYIHIKTRSEESAIEIAQNDTFDFEWNAIEGDSSNYEAYVVTEEDAIEKDYIFVETKPSRIISHLVAVGEPQRKKNLQFQGLNDLLEFEPIRTASEFIDVVEGFGLSNYAEIKHGRALMVEGEAFSYGTHSDIELLENFADAGFCYEDCCIADALGTQYKDIFCFTLEELSGLDPERSTYELDSDKLIEALHSLETEILQEILVAFAIERAMEENSPYPKNKGEEAFYRFGVRSLPADMKIQKILQKAEGFDSVFIDEIEEIESSVNASQEDWDM